MRQGDLAVEALDAKGSSAHRASVQTTMKMNAEQASKSPMYLSRSPCGASRRPKSGREESVKSIFQEEDRGNGGGMRAKDRGVNTGDPARCFGASPRATGDP